VQICTQCSTQSPDSAAQCENCGADLSKFSETSVALQKFIESPRVKYVHIMVYHDCCPACQDVEGAYEKDKVPHLPVEGCSHAQGCRCFYQPFLTELYP
jgi:hypothetical protein